MVEIHSGEGQPSMCGAFMRRWWLLRDKADDTAGENASEDPRVSDGELREPRASVRQKRGIVRNTVPPQTQRAAPAQKGGQS